MRKSLMALAVALLPGVASATTVVVDGGSYDIFADDYRFNDVFLVGDAADVLTFTFVNYSTTAAALTVFGATVQQLTAAFTDGVDISFGTFSTFIAQGVTDGFETTILLAANSSTDLVLDFGAVVEKGAEGGSADIDFALEAAAVPVPAAGLMLLGALGGLGVLRRRKSRA